MVSIDLFTTLSYNYGMKKVLVVLSILLITGFIGFLTYVSATNNVQEIKTQAVEEKPATQVELLSMINDIRTENGVAPLTVDETLVKSAQWKADKMAETGNFSHIDPATGKKDGLDYLLSLSPSCSYIGENLSWVEDESVLTAQEAIDVWMNSKPHREAILSPEYTSTGFGITRTTSVEHFCK